MGVSPSQRLPGPHRSEKPASEASLPASLAPESPASLPGGASLPAPPSPDGPALKLFPPQARSPRQESAIQVKRMGTSISQPAHASQTTVTPSPPWSDSPGRNLAT